MAKRAENGYNEDIFSIIRMERLMTHMSAPKKKPPITRPRKQEQVNKKALIWIASVIGVIVIVLIVLLVLGV
jgi:lipopolysaccharide/colanic/teichoic acid biosynthesis glycosyltransferase